MWRPSHVNTVVFLLLRLGAFRALTIVLCSVVPRATAVPAPTRSETPGLPTALADARTALAALALLRLTLSLCGFSSRRTKPSVQSCTWQEGRAVRVLIPSLVHAPAQVAELCACARREV